MTAVWPTQTGLCKFGRGFGARWITPPSQQLHPTPQKLANFGPLNQARKRHININLVIFFSLTEAPLPDPTPTPPNTPKRTRNGPETDPKRSENRAKRSPNGAKRSRNGPKSSFSGWDGRGVCRGRGGCGGCKGKRKSLHKLFCPVGLGTTPGLSWDFTGLVPGTNPVKTWDKTGFSPYFTQWKPGKPGFVPGTNPVCPWNNPGDEGRHRKLMWKKFTIAHKTITEPNFIIFELFSAIPALWLPNRIVSGITWSR